MQHLDLINRLRSDLQRTLAPLIPAGEPLALVGFPESQNGGDHATWLGELALAGPEVVHTCSWSAYDAAALRRAVGEGTLLVHGGAGFSDASPVHSRHLQLLQDFPTQRVVFLPQTAMFYKDEAYQASAAALRAHPEVLLVARDEISRVILQRLLGERSVPLAPDPAFGVSLPQASSSPVFDFLWLGRDEAGAVPGWDPGLGPGGTESIPLGSWEDRLEVAARGQSFGREVFVSDWGHIHLLGETQRAYQNLAQTERSWFWLKRALGLLRLARVVITDRLRAHILCTLAGIPHVLLSTSSGENLNFLETWCRPLDLCRVARSPKDAWRLAKALLEGVAPTRTDVSRWADPASLHESWRQRSRLAAGFVRPGSVLLDIGCGKMMIEEYLPATCRYRPSDVVRRDQRTEVCDLNRGEFPDLAGVDHLSVLGVLEYLSDPGAFWDWLAGRSLRLILSYVPLTAQFPLAERIAMGWLSHLRRQDLLSAAGEAGFGLVSEQAVPPDNILMVFDPKGAEGG